MLFRERRDYSPICENCEWTERLPPYKSVNDLCPRCHAQLEWRRGDVASFFENRMNSRGLGELRSPLLHLEVKS